MIKQWIGYLKERPGLLFLLADGIFFMVWNAAGSFSTDEAIYSQVARESLFSHSFLVLHWQGRLWFEKPPLLIWLTAAAFRLFGFSEEAAHFFPGLFALGSAVVLYLMAEEIFRNKLAGFFSAFVFLTVPLILLYSRTDMMEIPIGFFIAVAVWSVWKIFQGRPKWWLLAGASLGLAVMTKSVVGLLPLLLFPLGGFIFKKSDIWKGRYFWEGLGLFFLIAAPWHIYMTWRFRAAFWKTYFGFHVFSRFFRAVLPVPWDNNSLGAYPALLLARSGLWIGFFLLLVGALLLVLVASCSKNKSRRRSFLEKVFRPEFVFWAEEKKATWLFLFGWWLAVFLPFLLAQTKLPNYMALTYYPFSILVGAFLAYLFETPQTGWLFLPVAGALLNLWPSFSQRASDFGEARILLPALLMRGLDLGGLGIEIIFSAGLAVLAFFFYYFRSRKKYLKNAALVVIVGFNLLVPLRPLRNGFIKKFAGDLSAYSGNRPVDLFVRVRTDQYAFADVVPYYLPLGSQVENVGNRAVETVFPSAATGNEEVCFFGTDFLNKKIVSRSILRYSEGDLTGCRISPL